MNRSELPQLLYLRFRHVNHTVVENKSCHYPRHKQEDQAIVHGVGSCVPAPRERLVQREHPIMFAEQIDEGLGVLGGS